jgi:hypothetical protein
MNPNKSHLFSVSGDTRFHHAPNKGLARITDKPFVPGHSRTILQPTLYHAVNNNMAVTRSQKPKSGSSPGAAPAESAPVINKKVQKSKPKTKAEKKTAATTAPKPAKVPKTKKKKVSKRKGPKSAPKESSPEAPPPATPKPSPKDTSKTSQQDVVEAALVKFSNSEVLFNPDDITPELIEELGLAYVDLPSFHNAPASGTTRAAESRPARPQRIERSGTKRSLPKGFYSHPHLFREHWDAGPPFGTHSTYERATPPPAGLKITAPAEFPRGGGRSFWNNKTPRPKSASAPQPTTIWASPVTPSFGAQRSATPKSSPVNRVFFATPRRPSAVPAPSGNRDQLSPRGVRAGQALLSAVATVPSPAIDDTFEFDFGDGDDYVEAQQHNPFSQSNKNDRTTKSPAKSPRTVVRSIIKQVQEQPTTPPPRGGLFGTRNGPPPETLNPFARHHKATVESESESEDEDEDEGEGEGERPESPPVEVNNAQVFKRPTVADLRRERAMMHIELGGWVRSLEFAKREFDGVIGEIQTRMGVLKAVNRMQAPLRKGSAGGWTWEGEGSLGLSFLFFV